MRAMPIRLLALASLTQAGNPPSYSEAMAQNSRLEASPELTRFAESTIQPLLNSLQPGIRDCAATRSIPAGYVARFVVDLGQKPARVYDEAPTEFSSCVRLRMEQLKWPQPTLGVRYIPFELKGIRNEGDKKSIGQVTSPVPPSNTAP